MFYIYIIYSSKLDRYYVGYTADIEVRLVQHNSGISSYTSKTNDWKLMYQEQFNSKKEAHKGELAIKNKKSRKYIEWLIASAGQYISQKWGRSPVRQQKLIKAPGFPRALSFYKS